MTPVEFSHPESILDRLVEQHEQHFRTPVFDRFFIVTSWIVLLLSLPAAIAGYIGCFTLVTNSTKPNGPLIWLGLEAALSVLRILLWAWNPSFDERTEVNVRLKLTENPPLVTTEKDVGVLDATGNVLDLVPERRFLESITPHTGPLEQFKSIENIALYFTLSGDRKHGQKHLFMTVLDLNKRTAFTLHQDQAQSCDEDLVYTDALVTCNSIAGEMQAALQSKIGKDHPWRANHISLFDSLSVYYDSLLHALNQTNLYIPAPLNSPIQQLRALFKLPPREAKLEPGHNHTPMTASLPWKWHLVPKPTNSETKSGEAAVASPSLTQHDRLYLEHGYEHHLKTKLMANWGEWIVKGIAARRTDALEDCHHALADPSSDAAKWELAYLDTQEVWEWTGREFTLLRFSAALEDILCQRMEGYVELVVKERKNEQLRDWLSSELSVERKKRLVHEREQAMGRMENAMKAAVLGEWQVGQQFIQEKWTATIESGAEHHPRDFEMLAIENTRRHGRIPWSRESDEGRRQRTFVEQLKYRFTHWDSQRNNEQHGMEETIKRINEADFEHLDQAYHYPESLSDLVAVLHSKFAFLRLSQEEAAFAAKFSSATVYDTLHCDATVVRGAVQNTSARSVINVDPSLIQDIPENNHLLYIGSYDGEVVLPFVQQNRNRLWEQFEQDGNSWTFSSLAWTFYFSPANMAVSSVYSFGGTIAHIMIFLQTPARLRLRLLHFRFGQVSVSILEKGKNFCTIRADEIFLGEFRLQDYDLDQLEPGRHELELIVREGDDSDSDYRYYLRNIMVELINSPPSNPSDNDSYGEIKSWGTDEAVSSDEEEMEGGESLSRSPGCLIDRSNGEAGSTVDNEAGPSDIGNQRRYRTYSINM